MADGGENPRPITVNLPITVHAVVEAPQREGDFHHTETNIVNCNIDTVQAGYSQDRQETAQVISGSAQSPPDESDDKATLLEKQRSNTATNSSTPDLRPVSSDSGPIEETPLQQTVSARAQATPKELYSPDEGDSVFCPNPDQTKSTEEPKRFFPEGFSELRRGDSDRRSNLSGETTFSEDCTKQPLSLARNVSWESQTTPSLTGEQQSEFDGVGKTVTEMKIRFSKASMLNDRARYLLAKSPPDYDGVVDLLQDSIVTSSDDIVGKTLLAESLFQLQKTEKAHKEIKALKKTVKKLRISGNDIMAYAKDLAANSAHSRAIILYPIASSIFRSNALSSDEVMDNIHECNVKMFESVQKLKEKGDNSGNVGLESMEKMCNKLTFLSNVNPDKITVERAWVLDRIGFIHKLAKNYPTSLNVRRKAIELLNGHFDGNQSMYQVHGRLLHNIGATYENLKDFDQAKEYYLEAAKASRHATDFSSDAEKSEKIKESEESHKYVCSGNTKKGRTRLLPKFLA